MSAGPGCLAAPTVSNDPMLLAPRFRDAVAAALAECNAVGLDAVMYEGYRSDALQRLYYARGRTVIPPTKPVTNASSNLYSWHGYGLAADIISAAHGWDRPVSWFEKMGAIFRLHGCKWGGDWKQRDLPHVQWGACKPSPSDEARRLYAAGGMEAVWRAVGAVGAV